MPLTIVEIKARRDPSRLPADRAALRDAGARFVGTDRQIDTYFHVPTGRLKLREGNIENTLVQYDRPDEAGPRVSRCTVVPVTPGSGLKEALVRALGVRVVVDKVRDIWWVDNVKVHLDQVAGLGCFLELEAQDPERTRTEDELRGQCDDLMALLDVAPADLVPGSYADLLLAANPAAGPARGGNSSSLLTMPNPS